MRGVVMNARKHQQGITLFGFVLTMFLIGFVAFTTLKLFPVYMEHFSILSSLESLEQERDKEFVGAAEVRNTLLRRFQINNVTQASKDDISIIRDGQIYHVEIAYEVRIPFLSNVSLVVSFNNTAEVPAR
jgi:DMSO reductase anchor subunit